MFRVIVGLEQVAQTTSFNEAFKIFFMKIKEEMKTGCSIQWLETSNFIEYNIGDMRFVMGLYDARDFACDIGLLCDGELLEGIEEPHPSVVFAAFERVTTTGMLAIVADLAKAVDGAFNRGGG